MDFGKVDNIEGIDFILPPDPALNIKVLEKGKEFKNQALYCGCAKWGRKEWVGKLYPKGVKEKDFLQYYVKEFNSIELNATHYRIHPPSTIIKWRDTASGGFKFCPKFPKSISHISRLKNAEKETDKFIESIMHFEDKLGPCFLQLPPNFSPKNFKMLEEYLKSLPSELRTCVELRHPAWFEDVKIAEELFDMLIQNKTGTVISDTAGRRDVLHMHLTLPIAFIRFVGNALHPTDFSRINDWVERLGLWMNKGLKETYFFLHQHEELDSPKLAAYFIKKANAKLHTQLKEPKFADSTYSKFI